MSDRKANLCILIFFCLKIRLAEADVITHACIASTVYIYIVLAFYINIKDWVVAAHFFNPSI